MSFFEGFILGFVQGLTEFLPVSSSGHLVLVQALFGNEKKDIVLEVFLHFGTLFAIIIVFRHDITKLISAFFYWIKNISNTKAIFNKNEDFRLLIFIIIGTIPATIFGFVFKNSIESTFSEPFISSCMLFVTGILLLATYWAQTKRTNVRLIDSIIIGFVQATALIPGISRSGSTISAGMFLGIEKNKATHFSFLLALPAILGATCFETVELIKQQHPINQIWVILIGTISAAFFGYFAIKILILFIQKGKFKNFAFYCLTIGILGIIYFS